MAETLTRSIKSQDAERAQETKRRLEPAPMPMKVLADESVPFAGLLGVSTMELPEERHAALLGNPRFSHSANNVQKAGLVTELQQTYGNQYVQRLLQSMKVQAKLTVSSPDDQYEREADRVADTVTRAPASSVRRQAEPEEEEEEPIQTKLTNDIQVQRQAEEPEEEEEEPIQTKKAGGQTPLISSSLQSRINSLKGGGQPLPESTRKYFEPRFGSSFNNVRIHNNSQAANIAKSIDAKAFTTGKDIVFGAGEYSPETSRGKRLLAHELTHVVQQSEVPVLQRQEADAPEAEKKEKGEEEGKLTQKVYRFGVAFVDDGIRAQLQTGEEEVETKEGEEEEEAPEKAPNFRLYGYIKGSEWAWKVEPGEAWEDGKLVPVQVAEDDAIKALDSAWDAIGKSSLDEKSKEESRSMLLKIAGEIVKCFTGRAKKPFVHETEEEVRERYEQEMNTGEYAGFEYMNDKVRYKKVAGSPPKKPAAPKKEAPEIKVKNPIVIDGFPFNRFNLPVKGEGREQLKLLCNLDPDIKKGIIIDRITGHTDIVPVTRPGPRFGSLEELSLHRIEPVLKELQDAKFTPPKKIEGLGDSKAEVMAPTATRKERAKDRKVVVYWHWEQPKK